MVIVMRCEIGVDDLLVLILAAFLGGMRQRNGTCGLVDEVVMYVGEAAVPCLLDDLMCRSKPSLHKTTWMHFEFFHKSSIQSFPLCKKSLSLRFLFSLRILIVHANFTGCPLYSKYHK